MIIGLVGFKGSGKDTFAKTLRDEYGFKRDSFAAPLKDAVSAIFGWHRDMVEGGDAISRKWREEKDHYWSEALGRVVTPRSILQEVGTEVFRDNFDSNIWVKSFMARNYGQSNIVVTDVRFVNEMETIKALGGKLLRVKRGPDPLWLNTLVNEVEIKSHKLDFISQIQSLELQDLPHASEWAWVEGNKLIDDIISNDGTLVELKAYARGMMLNV